VSTTAVAGPAVTRARRAADPPSGRQFELTCGEQRAVVVEVGGGLRAYSVGARDLLDRYELDEMCTAGRGQVLIPWPNRLHDGRYEFEGRRHQLALTAPERHNAIHGLVRWAAWTPRDLAPDRVVMEHLLRPQPGYPFALGLSVAYVLSGEGLRVRTTATNVGAEPCPFGSGSHPYLTAGTELVDEAILCAPARAVLLLDARGSPSGLEPIEDTDYDFRRPRPIRATRLDHCFTELERDDDGLARIELLHPRDGTGVTLWADAAYRYLMLFTGDPLPEVARRSVAVEPMTCPPNAFRTGEALIALEPGASWTGEWGIAGVTADALGLGQSP
jgi:aldose 1-epimerase